MNLLIMEKYNKEKCCWSDGGFYFSTIYKLQIIEKNGIYFIKEIIMKNMITIYMELFLVKLDFLLFYFIIILNL